MPEIETIETPEAINSLAPITRETAQSIAPAVAPVELKKASEVPQAPRFMIPIESGPVYEPSFRKTEAEATIPHQLSYEDYLGMKNLSNKDSDLYQLEDRDTGKLMIVRAENVGKAREDHIARKEASRKSSTTSIAF